MSIERGTRYALLRSEETKEEKKYHFVVTTGNCNETNHRNKSIPTSDRKREKQRRKRWYDNEDQCPTNLIKRPAIVFSRPGKCRARNSKSKREM